MARLVVGVVAARGSAAAASTPWSITSITSLRAHVEVHDQALDRPGVAVVGRVGAEERDAARDAPAVLGVVAERRRRATGRSARASRSVMPRRRERGDVLGVLLRGEDRVRSPRSSAARAACPRPSRHSTTSPVRDRHDDLDAGRASGPAPRARATSRSTGSPAFHCAQVVLGRLVQHDVREQRALGQPAVGADDLDRAVDLGRREHVERMHGCPPIVRDGLRCQRVLTTRTSSAKRPSGSSAARAFAAAHSRTVRSVAAGSGIWLLCESNASILRSSGVGDVDVVRRRGNAGRQPDLVDRVRFQTFVGQLGMSPPVAGVRIHRVERRDPGREVVRVRGVDPVEVAFRRLHADHPLRADGADHPGQIASQLERRFEPSVGVAEEADVVDADHGRGRPLLVAPQRAHLRSGDPELGAARVAVGDDAVRDRRCRRRSTSRRMPAIPKSTSSGWAITTRMRSTPSSTSSCTQGKLSGGDGLPVRGA